MEGISMRKKISVVVPCYNEEDNVKPMADKLTEIMQGLDYDYEIIFTDNCSKDATRQHLRELAAADSHIKVLMNNRNYGAGGRSGHNTGKYCSGDIYIHIACDFQEPPELIPEFVKYWEEGYKVVAGQKIASEEGKVKYFLRSLFYRIINLFSDIPQYAHMSGLLLVDREVLDEWIKTDDDIILRNAIADMGYQVKLIQYVQKKRRSGKSSYNVWRYLTFALNSMINTSTTPLRLMTILGFAMSIISFIIGVVYLIMKLTMWYYFPTGSAPTLIGMLFLGSVQLLFMGILGEYIGVILRKVSNQPGVIVGEKLNFEEETSEEKEEQEEKDGVL